MKLGPVIAVLGLAACMPSAPTDDAANRAAEVIMPELGLDSPPLMGRISGTLAAKRVAWETFDFSVGAYDASASVRFVDGRQTLQLFGYAPGNAKSQSGNVLISGNITGLRKPGPLQNVRVQIPLSTDIDGPGLSSVGQTAVLMIDKIDAPKQDESGYGHAAGRVTAQLCPVAGATGGCQTFTVAFDTQVQFDSTQTFSAR